MVASERSEVNGLAVPVLAVNVRRRTAKVKLPNCLARSAVWFAPGRWFYESPAEMPPYGKMVGNSPIPDFPLSR